MSPKRDTSQKHNAIIDAAIREFQAVGYDQTSMDRIADSAGASKRTVYNHFASKEELFQAALERLREETKVHKQVPYTSCQSLESQLLEFVEAKEFVAQNPTWLGFMKVVTAVFIANPELAQEAMTRMAQEEDMLVIWLEEAMADGRVKVDNPRQAAQLFWSMVSGLFYWPALYLGPMADEQAEPLRMEMVKVFLARYGIG